MKEMPILSMPDKKEDKYGLGKYENVKEKEQELQEALNQEEKIMPSFRTAEMRMYFGEFPKYKNRTQEDLNQCQVLMTGAVQLMFDRLMGNTEFDISQRQYEQFLCDAKEKTKLFTWGYETLDETAEWVFDAINVEYESDEKVNEE